MRNRWRVWLFLVLVWAIAAGVILWSRAVRPSPEAVAAYIHSHQLAGLSAAQREAIIGHVADQLNRLDFDQRQALRKTMSDRAFFKEMTAEERSRFLDLTLPEGFHQMMIALNKMDPDKRQRIVRRALDNLRNDSPEMSSRLDQQDSQKIISHGLQSFYNDANADVKLDFAPVIEQLQRDLQ